ncbi:MAG: hypothetical protein WAW80_01170 [Candidatus Saccharimonadales bacterium]
MSQLTTIEKYDPFAVAAKIDYFAWLEGSFDNQIVSNQDATSETETSLRNTNISQSVLEHNDTRIKYDRETEALRQELGSDRFSKLGAVAVTTLLGVRRRKQSVDVSERIFKKRKTENKFLNKMLDNSSSIIVGAAAIGIVGRAAFSVIAAENGFDTPTYTGNNVQITPFETSSNNSDSLSDLLAVRDIPTGDIVAPVPAPAPTPLPDYAPTSTPVEIPAVTPSRVNTHEPIHEVIRKPVHVRTPAPAQTPIHAKTPTAVPDKKIAIVTGGATHPDAQFEINSLIENGTLDPKTTEIIPNNYPAEMAPFVGGVSTQVSTEIGAKNIRDIIAQHPDSDITSYAFSEGNFPNDTVAAELYRQKNSSVNFVGYGSGNSASGLLNSPLAEMVRPIVDGFGITRTPPAPGSTQIFDGRDGFAGSAHGDLGKLISNALSPNHRIPRPDEPRVMTFDVSGVHYEVVGEPIPLPPGAILTSGIPAPGFGGLPELRPADLMPGGINPIPNVSPLPDANQLPPAPLNPVVEPPLVPAPDSIKLATPSFIGELPCVAPNGSEYFTPANASC